MTDADDLACRAAEEAYLAMEAADPDAVAAHFQSARACLDRLQAEQDGVEQDQTA
jgi:hypothetical protein